jgi:hypothetical protein
MLFLARHTGLEGDTGRLEDASLIASIHSRCYLWLLITYLCIVSVQRESTSAMEQVTPGYQSAITVLIRKSEHVFHPAPEGHRPHATLCAIHSYGSHS